LKFLERRTKEGAAQPSPWPLITMSFVAAYREAIEIVLFFRALVLDMTGQRGAIALGAAAGTGLLATVVWAFGKLGRRINPRPVMTASSVLLSILALSLVGQGMRALQMSGAVSLTPIDGPSLSILGIYPSIEGLCAQAFVLLLIVVPVVRERLAK